jgi:superfamily I DNA and/or RNA helicase
MEATLGTGAKVGTVDKGQEAHVVIISMCSSDVNEGPRGIDFLFSKNRLNVAISRAKSLAIVVGSPALGNASVSSLRQMELAAIFCRVLDSTFERTNIRRDVETFRLNVPLVGTMFRRG